MGSQTEYIFQKPGLKKSMEKGMFVLKYCRDSENPAALTSTKNPRITLPPGKGVKKVFFLLFLFYKKWTIHWNLSLILLYAFKALEPQRQNKNDKLFEFSTL